MVDVSSRDVDDELLNIARGDGERHRLLRESLERLANGAAGPELQEMAREVVAGRVTLRRAMLSGAYSEAWGPHVDRLIRWHDNARGESAPAETSHRNWPAVVLVHGRNTRRC